MGELILLHQALGFLLLAIAPAVSLGSFISWSVVNGWPSQPYNSGELTGFVLTTLVVGMLASPIPLAIAHDIWDFRYSEGDGSYPFLWLLWIQLIAVLLWWGLTENVFGYPHNMIAALALFSSASVVSLFNMVVAYPLSLIKIVTD